MTKSALIAGVSGIVGNNLARRLVAEGWDVAGLARRPGEIAGVRPVAGDLLSFWRTWSNCSTVFQVKPERKI